MDGFRHSGRLQLAGIALAMNMLVTGCGGGGGGGGASSGQPSSPAAPAPVPAPAPAPTRPFAQSDLEIAMQLYTDSARTPAGFYSDSPAPATGYSVTAHVKNSDVTSQTVSARHELCTDDWNQALTWSETMAAHRDAYSDLVATTANDRYFEFGRVPRGQPDAYVRDRVYRCTYLDRGDVDLAAPAGAAGRMNRTPLGAEDLRQLSEYLWLFTSYNNFGNAVLASVPGQSGAALTRTLYLASLTHPAASAGCDRIDVIAWTHVASPQTGDMTLERTAVTTFGARQVGATAELCTL
jgi:hypothetical protein